MPLLLILLTIAACLPTSRFPPPAGVTRLDTLLLTLVTMAVPVLVTALGCRAVVRQVTRQPSARPAAARRYNTLRARLAWVTIAAAIVCVVGWGWSDAVASTAVVKVEWRWVLAPFAELLMPLPYFVALALNWVSHHAAERALHRASAGPEGFWSLPGYLVFQARNLALVLGLPVGVCCANLALTRFAPETAASPAVQFGALLAVFAAFVGFPRVVPTLLGLEPLPPGPERDRLHATAARLGVRFTRIMLWPTRGSMMNALVMGVIPQARYVIFTDRILSALIPEELVAVLGHECGHVRRGHLWLYLAFLVLSSVFLAAVGTVVEEAVVAQWPGYADLGWAAGVAPLAAMGVWLFVVFGWLSRTCEREADVFGARAGSCADPDCGGHTEDTPLVPGGRGLCRTGARAMVSALDRVGESTAADRPTRLPLRRRLQSWLRAWQHGPMSYRIAFLTRLADDPALGDRTDRAAFRAKAGLLLTLAAGVAVSAAFVDWDVVLAEM